MLVILSLITIICIRNIRMSSVSNGETIWTTLGQSDNPHQPVLSIDSFFNHDQTYSCHLCNATTFTDLTSASRHIEFAHRGHPNGIFVDMDRYECKLCRKDYKCRNVIIGHLMRKHGIVISPAPSAPYTGAITLKNARDFVRKGAFRTVYPTIPPPRATTLPSAIYQYYDKVIHRLIDTRRKIVRVRVKKKKKTTLSLNREDRDFFTWLDNFNNQ